MASKQVEEPVSRHEVVKDFAEDTTMHGLKYLFAAGIFRKIIWFCLIIASCVLVYIQVYQQIGKFLENSVSTDISINYPSSIQFPTVMICNSNTFRINKIYEIHGLYDLIAGAFAVANNATTRYKQQDFSQQYKNVFSNLTTTYKGNATKFFQTAGHQIKDMLIQCTDPNGNNCDYTKFKTVMQESGPCYIFDSKNITVSQAGPSSSLTLYLNIQAYEQMMGMSLLSSFKVFVFDKSLNPQEMIHVAPGFMSVIGLKYHSESRITSCIDPINTTHFTDDEYSGAVCQADNHLCAIENQCKCTAHYAPKRITVKPCATVTSDATCQESCDTSGYSTSLSLAKISNGVLQELVSINSDTIKENFTTAMEAAARSDPNLKRKMKTFFDNIDAALKPVFALGMQPNASSWTSIRQFLYNRSTAYQNFVVNASLLLQKVSTASSSQIGPGIKCYQNGGGPPTTSTTSINESSLLNGYNSTMQSSQVTIFNQNFAENKNTTTDIYKLWSHLDDLLTYPCENTLQLGNIIGDGNPKNYFDDMMNKIYNYIDMKQTKYSLAENDQDIWKFINNDMMDLCHTYVGTAEMFSGRLKDMTTYNLTKEIFSHLDDPDINNSPFWLAVFYASTAKYQISDFLPIPDPCVPRSSTGSQSSGSQSAGSQSIGGGGGGPQTGSSAYQYDDCFTSSSGCSNCSSSTQTQGSAGGGQSGPSGGQSMGGGPSGIGMGPSGQQQQTQTCCARQLPLDISYYRNFFKFLYDNMAQLINETDTQINATKAICQNVSDTYKLLYTELETYKALWEFQYDFYSENFLGIQIYFSEISQQTITQSQPYDFFSLICDVGGSLGLFLGASILTFFEVIDMIVIGLCMRKK